MIRTFALLLAAAFTSVAQNYQATKATDHGVEIVHLVDRAHGAEVSIVPSIGNRVYEYKIHGQNLLYFPGDIAQFKASGGKGMNGIPVLLPWANRLDKGGFWAHDKFYKFNTDVGTVRTDANNIAIHGMLLTAPLWEVRQIKADGKSAWVTSRLVFWTRPELMANWPFAHEYVLTYRLSDGALEVSTTVKNLSSEPMPVMAGFHPYFNIPGVPRTEWSAHMPVTKHVETDAHLVPTGEMQPADLSQDVSLRDKPFDDGFTGITRGSDGKAVFSVYSGSKKIEVIYGPKYQVAVVYAPPGANFICFEPMASITNGANLAHEGKYSELQSIAPGASWTESFWLRGTGF